MPENPLVSCLCITRNRVPMLERAVACFQAQTYHPRELVIQYETNDLATHAYVESLRDPMIRHAGMPPGATLGARRNMAIADARGHYIILWDDDDWYAPTRLAVQIDVLQKSPFPACVLSTITMYDAQTGQAFLSQKRTWEGTLAIEKAALPSFAELPRGEDKNVIETLYLGRKLAFIERPELYIYTFHGANTWDRAHWQELLHGARALSPEATQEIRAKLALPTPSPAEPETPVAPTIPHKPLVSCVCVTRNRVPMLRRAVACFRAQTYQPRELVILYETDDLATCAYVETLREPMIRLVASRAGIPLGALRNTAIEQSRGHYVAQWDDDDWYAPNRLAVQIGVLQVKQVSACVLATVIMYDELTGNAFLPQQRTWEGSLVAEKAALPPYPALPRAEDTDVIEKLLRDGKLVSIVRPELFIYTFHGSNTWDRIHWGELLRGSRALPQEETERVRAVLALPPPSPAELAIPGARALPQNPLVSCLCVTRNRVPMLERAVACFRAQTYQPRELVIHYETDDLATCAYVETLREPMIRLIASRPGIPLGALRNTAIEQSRGHFIAQWDDDDWYAPTRLAMQIDALEVSHFPACVLVSVIMYDEQTGQAFVSQRRTWEGSLVAVKGLLPPYPELRKSEDFEVIVQLLSGRRLVIIERPDLYVYTFHGSNTWDRTHWGELLRGALALPAMDTQRVQAALALPPDEPVVSLGLKIGGGGINSDNEPHSSSLWFGLPTVPLD